LLLPCANFESDAMRLAEREAYSYRGDAAIPAFDDEGPVVFMDGECMACTQAARLIARLDRSGAFRICPIQSPLGASILKHYGLAADDPESWLYLEDGRACTSIDAMIRAGWRMGGLGRLLAPLALLPRPAQNWLYRRLARSRYRLFGRSDMCMIPDDRLRQRLIS
jgi:predicted DCC family thiol-disulfide oxidoreductase YuxK